MRSLSLSCTTLAILMVLIAAGGALAQSHWWYPEAGSALTFEFVKPHFAPDAALLGGNSFANGIGFLGGRHNIADNLMLYWELPFANYDANRIRPIYYGDWDYYYIEDEFAFGNPLVGLEQPIVGRSLFVRTSVRFPVASEEKEAPLSMGYFGAYDRFEAFIPKVYTISLDLGWREANDQSPLEAQVTLGTITAVPNEGDAELFASYSSFLGFTMNKIQAGLFFGGRLILSEDVEDFTDRFMNFCGATLRIKPPVVEPGIEFRYNLDDNLNEISDYSYGISFAIPFGSDGDYSGDDWK